MMDIYLQIAQKAQDKKLKHNKIVSAVTFVWLISSVFFIQLHPNSVGYYFAAGFFTCKMLELICEKTEIKYFLQDTMDRLNKLKKGLL